MARTGGCYQLLISIFNICILIMGIIIMCLSVGYWHDYAVAGFAMGVALVWLCIGTSRNNVAITCYMVLTFISLLFTLGEGIYQSVRTKQYQDFCNDFRDDLPSPPEGCYDWRNWHIHQTVGIIVCSFLTFILQILIIINSCLVAKAVYNA